MLQHSPPLPLIVRIEPTYRNATQFFNNITHALQYPDRVISISIHTCVVDPELLMALDKTFPALEIFSIMIDLFESVNLRARFFPENFVAPHLRTVYLQNANIFEVLPLPISVNTSLVSLCIEQIEDFSYLPPVDLAECVSSMPQLEKLSIRSLASFLLSDTDRELWGTQITRTALLPNLRELTFGGDSAYLDKMLALISTPFLQCFDVAFFSQRTLAVQHISEFLSTIQNFDFQAVEVSFSDRVTIAYRPTQTSDSLSRVKFRIDDGTDRLDQQVATAIRICAAVGPALNAVKDVALEFNICYVPNDFAVRSELWRTFLRSFEALRTLRTDVALVPELSKVLHPDNGTAAEELLPMLSELVVLSRINLIHNPFASLIDARSLAGRAIYFHVVKRRSPPFRTFTLGNFDAYMNNMISL
jgi:hypothetical protein